MARTSSAEPASGNSRRKLGRREFVEFLSALTGGSSIFGGAILAQTEEGKKVSKDLITRVEEMQGLRFTEAQRGMVLNTLENYVRNFQRIREMSIPPEVPPAVYFLPETRVATTVRAKGKGGR